MSARSSGRAASSSKRPPLNQSTRVKPTWPPVRMAAKSWAAFGGEARRGRRGEASSIFWNRLLGQQADVLGEHAEDQAVDEVGDGLRRRGRGRAGAGRGRRTSAAASAVRASRVFVGLQALGVGEGGAQQVALGAVEQVVEGEGRGPPGRCWSSWCGSRCGRCRRRRAAAGSRARPRSCRSWRVGGVEVLVPLPLYSQAKQPLAPDVGPALAAGGLGRALLEGEPVARRVGGRRGRRCRAGGRGR